MIDHVDPELPVSDDASSEGGLHHTLRGYGCELDPAELKEVLQRLPGELDRVLEPLDGALFLQVVEDVGPPLERRLEQREGSRVVLEALEPTDVLVGHGEDYH
jgi:hypothetical protein